VGRKPLVNNCWYKIITGEKREERRVKPVLQRMRERRKGIIMALWAEIFLCMPGSAPMTS